MSPNNTERAHAILMGGDQKETCTLQENQTTETSVAYE